MRHGYTFGSPITLLIDNKDWENWQEVMSITAIEKQLNTLTRLRPGHADTTGTMKYFQSDAQEHLGAVQRSRDGCSGGRRSSSPPLPRALWHGAA